jgi:hypothetical protein
MDTKEEKLTQLYQPNQYIKNLFLSLVVLWTQKEEKLTQLYQPNQYIKN